jgi:hypothetical protein
MKTLQRQNTKREIVKKVRFQKNEIATTKVVEKEKERVIDTVVETPGAIETALKTELGTPLEAENEMK